MSAMMTAVMILPVVWATEDVAVVERKRVEPEVAFYRKYTEGMLGRYAKMSMEAGRVPSLLGRELFRGNVTHYRVASFEDVVIFVHDMEMCLKRLDVEQQRMLTRILVQRYTHAEVAHQMRVPTRTFLRRYEEAVDRLTSILLQVKLLEPLKACQGA